jgi:anti-sigma factor RsiW
MSDERELTCQELTEVLTDYLEGAMAPDEVVRFEAHLEECDGCVTYVEQMRATIRTVSALRPADVELTVPEDLLVAFRAWKHDV